ncbi:MAG: 3-hydroxybutyryl-CoA dehydrogenase [Proteobacteria bacterium]|nr:3-hydroxybutyryl-CoA dehydrogenase [Pseudomonadota bacterium]
MTVEGINTIGVLGAGQMGGGIAQVAAQAGYTVILSDISEERSEAGKAKIAKFLARAVTKGRVEQADADAALGRITPVGGVAAFSEAQLVVEAATENLDLKLKLFKEIDAVTRPEAILASNTSSISITKLGSVVDRPERFIGMHFMNPVPVMKLVEVISGLRTATDTLRTTVAVAESMGKTCVEARDFPGFAVNRILMPMINEAFYTLYEGIASAEGIDAAMKLGTNQPMGPLTLADFIGLDTCLAIMEVLHEGLGDGKYRPCPLLRKYVEAGTLGRKSGVGVYDYRDNA